MVIHQYAMNFAKYIRCSRNGKGVCLDRQKRQQDAQGWPLLSTAGDVYDSLWEEIRFIEIAGPLCGQY